MKSVAIVAVFAAGALAAPYKRAVVTDVEMVYVTDIVTVTAGEPVSTAASTPATVTQFSTTTTSDSASTSTAAPSTSHWPSFWQDDERKWATTSVSTSASTSTSVAPAPTTTSTTPVVASTSSATLESSSAWTSVWTSTIVESSAATSAYSALSSAVQSATSAQALSPSAVAGADTTIPTSYSDITVLSHNLHRANHSSQPLEWDAGLASTAQTIAESCIYEHNTNTNGGGYGQNIAAGVEATNISSVITDLFYNGEVNWFNGLYGEAQPDMTNFEHWGHFSQIVWNATTHVGCFTQYCPNGLANVGSDVPPYFTVCNYVGAGNFAGEYAANIAEPLGHPTAQWNTGL